MDNQHNKNQFELMLYKILYDMLFLLLLVIFGFILLEGLVPGFFISQPNFTKIFFVFFAILIGIGYLGKKNSLTTNLPDRKNLFKNKFVISLFVIFALLAVNATKGLPVLEIIIIAGTTVAVGIFFFRLLFSTEK